MPRFKVQDVHPYPRAELVRLLATELGRESGSGEPLIYENRIGPTDTLHVVVIWERWNEVPAADRAGVILDAYESFDRSVASKVVIAMGVTMEEGIELRLLPYGIVLIPSEGFQKKREALVAAMKEEGAVLTRQGWQLRFPTEDLAKEAFERLSKKIPGNFWALQRDVSTVNG